MRTLAVIPAFNEEACLAETVVELIQVCPGIDYLVVNDGSQDGTGAVITANRIKGLTLPVNTGLASAFRTGMRYAHQHNYDSVVQYDADGQHIPSHIPFMANIMEQEDADIVIASRYLSGDVQPSGARGFGSKLISKLIKATTGAIITDPTSGMRMYNKRMIKMFAEGFDVAPEPDTLAYVARKGGKIVEIPATMRERQGGESYFHLGSIIRYMSRTCLSILLFQWLR